ncbi:MAG: glycosyltransferase [Phycisphaeraceae bacterium]|nr:glycosyltransferase [Phycisphaeraceae bacterium]
MELNPKPQLDVLLVSELPLWPLDRGYCVHGVNMLRALKAMGLRVAATTLRPSEETMPGWLSERMLDWPTANKTDIKRFALGWHGKTFGLRCKVAEHQALNGRELAGLLTLVEQVRPGAVIAVGQHGPVILRGLSWAYPNLPRVWYAADEPVSFQLSMLAREGLGSLRHRARLAVVFGLMQVLYNRGNPAHRLSAAIGVSPKDTKRLGIIGGCKAKTIRNGVDTDYYQPDPTVMRMPRTCAFWGDLSFEPNVDAIRWFVKKVWRQVSYQRPDAKLTIMGRRPGDAVLSLADEACVEVLPDVPDLRPTLRSTGAAVMPMRCGHGIKNKLLEAAAMGMPILASPKAVKGLVFGEGRPPIVVCKGASDWVAGLDKVWGQPGLASATGELARQWVLDRHTWPGAAQKMQRLLQTLTPDEPIYYADAQQPPLPKRRSQQEAA